MSQFLSAVAHEAGRGKKEEKKGWLWPEVFNTAQISKNKTLNSSHLRFFLFTKIRNRVCLLSKLCLGLTQDGRVIFLRCLKSLSRPCVSIMRRQTHKRQRRVNGCSDTLSLTDRNTNQPIVHPPPLPSCSFHQPEDPSVINGIKVVSSWQRLVPGVSLAVVLPGHDVFKELASCHPGGGERGVDVSR